MTKGENADMTKKNTKTPDRYLLTADRIRVDEELFFEDDHINAYLETWFDVDLRFGLETEDTDDYVNLYADYYPESDKLVVTYIIVHFDGKDDEDFQVEDLADSERELIIRLMNEQCAKSNGGLNMADALKKLNDGEI